MLDQLIQLDKEVFLFLNGLGVESWDGFWLFVTNKWNSIPIYLILLVLSFKYLGLKKTILLLMAVTLLITVTDQLANFFKYGVQRLRPCHDIEVNGVMRLVKSYCGGNYGYFSAHAASSFALATFFSLLFKTKVRFIVLFLLIWAFLVSYSRIYIGVHFPLDILTGIMVGILFGWLFSKLYIFATLKIKA
ncbi:phosphatase PAP2 family protein [Croceitalea sp. MTPC9]|uniref:phosphatase PAP2 family protein n=1 Tax=unclassified Croceitalea TaxID=2632280 RepID=UPI002B3AF839|nr:phosphatase PAP2 family protein [Croceitalea sp. MTPC6]GMN15186.1 phosphatase PAP2 family protein [Croceitalea sp. MTPC9]